MFDNKKHHFLLSIPKIGLTGNALKGDERGGGYIERTPPMNDLR